MPEAYDMADTVHERVGKLEQEMHTVKHQMLHLERLPPRVSELERAFEGMQYIRADQGEMKSDIKSVRDSIQHISGDIAGFSRALKWVCGVVSLAAIATASVVWVLTN